MNSDLYQKQGKFMTHRSLCCMPIVTLLVGLFVLSVGFNFVFLKKINKLSNIVNTMTSPVDNDELQKMMEEVQRLSKKEYTNNLQYDIKTKKPIKNDFRSN
jgi:hypothetical protein